MRILKNTLVGILVVWGVLTLYVERTGRARAVDFGDSGAPRARIIYNPDPFYNLDERISNAIAEELQAAGWSVALRTVAATADSAAPADLYVLLANTYNWSPDWPMGQYVRRSEHLTGQPVVAITIGSGSTARAQRRFERKIRDQGARLLDSRTWWLLRPNDESRLAEPNAAVAVDQAQDWAAALARRFPAATGRVLR